MRKLNYSGFIVFPQLHIDFKVKYLFNINFPRQNKVCQRHCLCIIRCELLAYCSGFTSSVAGMVSKSYYPLQRYVVLAI